MFTLTEEEIKEFLEKAELITKEACKSKKAAREFLYDAGFVTKKGKLKKLFRDDYDVIKMKWVNGLTNSGKYYKNKNIQLKKELFNIWFAWYPVNVKDTNDNHKIMAWLEKVYRRNIDNGWCSKWIYTDKEEIAIEYNKSRKDIHENIEFNDRQLGINNNDIL